MSEGEGPLSAARESLRAARLLSEERLYRDAVSRAYYAILHAAHAALETKDLRPRTHGGALQALGQHFVEGGVLRPQVAEDFGFAMQLRQRADYSEDLPVTAADAEAVIRRAERFLSAVEGLLEIS